MLEINVEVVRDAELLVTSEYISTTPAKGFFLITTTLICMPHEPECVLEEHTKQRVHRMVDIHSLMPPLNSRFLRPS